MQPERVWTTPTGSLRLLRPLRDAGSGLILLICLLLAVQHLAPAALAVATARLVAVVEGGSGDGSTRSGLVSAIAMLVAVLVVRHGVEVTSSPLKYLARARVDGAQRSRVIGLAVTGLTVPDLLDPAVRDRLRLAAADPANWTERTPGEGALASLALVARRVGAVASCGVLLAEAPWSIPLVVGCAVVARVTHRRQWRLSTALWVAGIAEGRRSEYWRDVATSASEAKEARVFGFEHVVLEGIARHMLLMFEPAWQRQTVALRSSWRLLLLSAVPMSVVYVVVLGQVARGTMSLAAASAVLLASWPVFDAVASTADVADVEGSSPALRAAAELEALAAERRTAGARGPAQAAPLRGPERRGAPAIEFRDVSFRYPGADREVLERLDLTVEPGELLAVVGRNGAGKSTMISLLAGLFRPTSGQVLVDGDDLTQVPEDEWWSRTAFVLQDFVRYPLTVEENVRLGAAWATVEDDALALAAARSGLSAVVEGLPQAWSTPLSRSRVGGIDLSGGQWQQLALARAMYAVERGAGLVVLDEPTAHLDVRTERDIFDRLVDARRAHTTILISHRLATVRRADRIVVVEGGRVTESGTHAGLLVADGTYARMFRTQAERFDRHDIARRTGRA